MAKTGTTAEQTVTSSNPSVYTILAYETSREGTTVTYRLGVKMYVKGQYDWRNNRWAVQVNVNGSTGGINRTVKGQTSGELSYNPTGYWVKWDVSGNADYYTSSSVQYAFSGTTTVTNLNQESITVTVNYRDTGYGYGESGTYSWGTPYENWGTKTFTIPIDVGVLPTYTVSYDANGGTGAPSSQTKTQGVALTLSNTSPSKANTTTTWSTNINANGGTGTISSVSATATQYWGFTYWKSSYDNTTYNPGASYTTDAATTMVAQWYATGEATMTLPTADKFTKTGYVCIGFDANPNATTPTYRPGGSYYTTMNGNTLYAIYQLAPKNKSYVKVNGAWKQGDTYIKVNGAWKLADAVYIKVNGSWKESS